MVNKKEEIAIYNHIVSEISLIYTRRKGEDIELFEYPSRDPILLCGITGGVNYFKKENSICVNDIVKNRYFRITEDEIKINEGCLKQVNGGTYYLIEYVNQKETTLLDASFNKMGELANFPKNYYQSIFYQGYLFFICDSIENKVVDGSRSQIIKYNLQEDSLEGIFDATEFTWLNSDNIQEKGFVRQLICGFKDSLLIEVSKYHIICIAIESGETLWEISDFVSNEDHIKFLSYGASSSSRTPMEWLKDEKNNKLLLLSRHFYWSIDLLAKEARLESDFLDSMVLKRWNIQNTNLVENEIFFTGAQGFHTSPNRIGIYDINTKDVVWEYELKSGYFIGTPKVIESDLVVSDSNGYLHIFTKNNQEA